MITRSFWNTEYSFFQKSTHCFLQLSSKVKTYQVEIENNIINVNKTKPDGKMSSSVISVSAFDIADISFSLRE